MNKVIEIGRLTEQPELKHTAAGKSVLSVSIAVQRRFSKDTTDFIPCVFWERNAEFVEQYFSKGDWITVVGSLQQRNWEDKSGNRRTSYDVVCDEVYFCGNKRDSQTVENGSNSAQDEIADEPSVPSAKPMFRADGCAGSKPAKPKQEDDFPEQTPDEDLPF